MARCQCTSTTAVQVGLPGASRQLILVSIREVDVVKVAPVQVNIETDGRVVKDAEGWLSAQTPGIGARSSEVTRCMRQNAGVDGERLFNSRRTHDDRSGIVEADSGAGQIRLGRAITGGMGDSLP